MKTSTKEPTTTEKPTAQTITATQVSSDTPQTTPRPTQRPKLSVVTSEDGKRKILLSLMDVYNCPTRGVFPIDGDCERFLMCRRDGAEDRRIKGRVFRCPPGDSILPSITL